MIRSFQFAVGASPSYCISRLAPRRKLAIFRPFRIRFREGLGMSLRKRLGLLAFALVTMSQSGCLFLGATAAGGGVVGVAYLAGKTTRVVNASLDDTSMAVGSALRDLGLPIEDSHGTSARAEIDARLA